MFAALTLLPAMFGFIGPTVMSHEPEAPAGRRTPHRRHRNQGFLAPVGRPVQRRRLIPRVVALVIIVVLALPFFSLRLGTADQGNDPAGPTTRQAYDLLAKGSAPGSTDPSSWSPTVTRPGRAGPRSGPARLDREHDLATSRAWPGYGPLIRPRLSRSDCG